MNPEGWLAILIRSIKAWFDLRTRRRTFVERATPLLADGVLTDDRLRALHEHQTTLALAPERLGWVTNRLLRLVTTAPRMSQRCSPEQDRAIEAIVEHFGADRSVADFYRRRLACARMLYSIEHGELPRVSVDGVILHVGELAHWAEFGSIREERQISRRYEGGSRGVSLRIMKGVTYRVGTHRGRLVAERGWVDVSEGVLVLTNMRVVFHGDRKSVAAKWETVIAFQLFSDGVQVSFNGRAQPTIVKFKSTSQMDTLRAISGQLIGKLARQLSGS